MMRLALLFILLAMGCSAPTLYVRFSDPQSGKLITRASVRQERGYGVLTVVLPDGQGFAGELKYLPAAGGSGRYKGTIFGNRSARMDVDIEVNQATGEGVGKGVTGNHEYLINMTGTSER
jgi:hypothetical protein